MSVTNTSLISPTYNAVNSLFRIASPSSVKTINCKKLGHIIYNKFELSFIGKAIAKCKSQINTKFSELMLSALHLATIKGSSEIAGLLLSNGADVNSLDHKKFTPLHHAALTGNQTMINFLINHTAEESLRNIHDGTYRHILQLTQHAANKTDFKNTFDRSSITNFNPDFNPTCLKPNVKLVDEHVITAQQLVDHWEKKLKRDYSSKFNGIQSALQAAYKTYKKNPPQLIVDHVTHDDAGKVLSIPSNPCGVFAKQTIAQGEIIREYTGQIVNESPTDKTYFLNGFDAHLFRNEGAMMNDGFPNSYIMGLYDIDGLEERPVLIASEQILPGQEIVWDYGIGDNTKFSGHQELRPKALKAFFATHSWQNLAISYQSLFSDPSNLQSYSENLRAFNGLQYIFNTPTAFLDLIANGTIDQKAIETLKTQQDIWKKIHAAIWIAHMEYVLKVKLLIDKTSPEFSSKVIAKYRDAFSLIENAPDFVVLHATALSALQTLLIEFFELKIKQITLDANQEDKILENLSRNFAKKTLFNIDKAFIFLTSLLDKNSF